MLSNWYGYIAKKKFEGGRGGEGRGVVFKTSFTLNREAYQCAQLATNWKSVTCSVTACIGVPCNTTAMLTHRLTKAAIIISYAALIFESLVSRHTPFTLSAPPTNCREYR